MELQISPNVANDVSAMETVPEVGSPEEGYEIVGSGSLDFDSWIRLISEIEKTYSGNIKAISSVYDSFLSHFPLCHEYWRRYAEHVARLCTVAKAVEIFEQAVQSATYSVGLWVDYCSFSILSFADPSDIRRIFERGLSFVGKDFLCHTLWNMYIRFELSQQQWSFLAHILMRSLKFPTKSLHKYYDNFKEFAAFVEEDMSCRNSYNLEPHTAISGVEVAASNDEICHVIKELQDSSNVDLRSKALNKFIAIGERFYRKACKLHEKIDYFENYMERDFFDVKPLDDEQLENWHNYLDFIEKQEDFDWAVKLYERCLIPCANYPEFWMRYVEFMEYKGGREIANFALERATQVFLKDVSEMHIYHARFKEKTGDIEGARAAFLLCDTESDSAFVETAIKEANMEKRLGNLDKALDIYDEALKVAAENEKLQIIPILYIHFHRIKYLITGSADVAIDLLLAGIQRVPHSRLLLEELTNFAMMHDGSRYLNVMDPIMAAAITCGSDGSQDLSSKDREDLSYLYLKFVDYCGTTHDIRKAWNRHVKTFPHLTRSTSSHKHPMNRLPNEPVEAPRLVAKKPSRVHGVSQTVKISKTHKLLASKNHAIQPHETRLNEHREKENTPESSLNQSEDDPPGEFKRLKPIFENDISGMIIALPAVKKRKEKASRPVDSTHDTNELQVSQKYDQMRLETIEEDEHEVEAHIKPVSREKESNGLAPMSPTTLENTVAHVEKQNETDERKSESSLSFPGHQNLERQTDPPRVSSENAETCCETKSPKSDGRQPHQGSGLPNTTEGNTETIAQPVPNRPPQNYPNTPHPVQPQPHHSPMVQYPMQSNDQRGPIQNPQAYNQMLQYQYQQKQYQQQWMQMQQPYVHPQQQQYQMYQQYQAYYQQQYQQQQGQGYQQLLQQNQLQEYLQMQQYQQQMQHQQISAMPNQTWNVSHDQQAQGMTLPHTTNTPTVFAPYTQQMPDHMAAQPLITSGPTNVESPSKLQPASHGGPPSTSQSILSPSLQQTPETR